MPRASRHADVPPPPDLAALAGAAEETRRWLDGQAAEVEKIIAAARDGRPLPEGTDRRQWTVLLADLRQFSVAQLGIARELGRISAEGMLAAVCVAAERAEAVQEDRAVRHRHRAPRPRRSRKPGAGQLALISGGLAASIAAGAAVGSVDSAHYDRAPVASHVTAGLPVLSPAYAVRAPSTSPVAYVPRHARPSPMASGASHVPSPPPPSVSPSPVPPSPAPAPSLVDFSGTLDVQTAQVAIGPLQGGQVTFSAVGGSASWTVSAPAGLVLSARSGILGDGQAVVIEVSVVVGTPAGSGVITVTDGDGRSVPVPVTWQAVPGTGIL